jgi:thiol-disulfide isomerase/thioredoxin
MSNRWIYTAGLVIAGLLAFFLYNRFRVAPDIDFRMLEVYDLGGNGAKIAGTGRKTILAFGASWCGPCNVEMREMKEAGKELDGIDVVIISDEPEDRIRAMKERGDYPFTFMRLGKSFSAAGIHSIPTTYLLNRNGEVKKKIVGAIDWSDNSTREHYKRLLEQ